MNWLVKAEKLPRVYRCRPLCSNRIDGVSQPEEKRLQIVLAGLLDLGPVEVNIVDDNFLTGDEFV